MVIEALMALGIVTVATVNTPAENKVPQEIKSVSTTVDATKPAKLKAKPKKIVAKKATKKTTKADTTALQSNKELVKTEPSKPQSVAVSSAEQKSTQSNLLYYILGIFSVALVSSYFYFRNRNKIIDSKLSSSDELKKSLQQTANNEATIDPQTNLNDQIKK